MRLRVLAGRYAVCRLGASDPLPDAILREVEEERALRAAIAALAPRCRRMVDMLFFESPARPYRAVAAQLGLAAGSIGFIRNRCLRRLRSRRLPGGIPRAGRRRPSPRSLRRRRMR